MDPRSERLRVWASVNGFAEGEADEAFLSWLPLRVLGSVVDREIDHVLEGSYEDADVGIFELRQGSGSAARLSSCALTAIPYGFPPLILANTRAPNDLGPLLGEPLIDAAPAELAGAFEIRTEDPALARELLREPLLPWLLEWSDRPPAVGFELGGSWLLSFAPLLEPEELPDLLDALLGFRDRIPDAVFDLYPMRPTDGDEG